MEFKPKSEATRQFIIESTADIFNRKGYAGTSMSDLTEATKLTKGSIYGNFENKEDVALATFDYNSHLRTSVIKEKISKAETYKEKLMVFATIFSSKENSALPKGGCPYLNMGTEADDTHEPLRQKVADGLISWKKDIENIIYQGIEEEEFKIETNASQIALTMVAMIEGAILIGKVTKKPSYLDTVLESVKVLISSIEKK